MRKHFTSSIVFTVIGLFVAGLLGWREQELLTSDNHRQLMGGLSAVLLCSILGLLELSLSFDNALINASVIRRMSPKWQRRFLTWGMLIAVFGMRLIFPLAIVGLVAWINPLDAFGMALHQPDQYAEIMKSVHVPVAGFGGSFLLMVSLRHFLNHQKEVHWFASLEHLLARMGRINSVEVLTALVIISAMTFALHERHPADGFRFLMAAVIGVISHLALGGLNALIGAEENSANGHAVPRASIGLFLYLEIQDASFSFDGVVGAFAITSNLFFIAIGLGIGAMFVRSLTLALVERDTLARYRYIETGAFYAIGFLSITMLIDAFIEVPEMIPGLASAGIIAASFWSSIRHNRQGHAQNF